MKMDCVGKRVTLREVMDQRKSYSRRGYLEKISKSPTFAVAAYKVANTLFLLSIIFLDGVCGSCTAVDFVHAAFCHAKDAPKYGIKS